MRKQSLLFLIVLFLCGIVQAQIYTPVVQPNYGHNELRQNTKLTSRIPHGVTPTLNDPSNPNEPGAVFYQESTGHLWAWTGFIWVDVTGGGGVNIYTSNGTIADEDRSVVIRDGRALYFIDENADEITRTVHTNNLWDVVYRDKNNGIINNLQVGSGAVTMSVSDALNAHKNSFFMLQDGAHYSGGIASQLGIVYAVDYSDRSPLTLVTNQWVTDQIALLPPPISWTDGSGTIFSTNKFDLGGPITTDALFTTLGGKYIFINGGKLDFDNANNNTFVNSGPNINPLAIGATYVGAGSGENNISSGVVFIGWGAGKDNTGFRAEGFGLQAALGNIGDELTAVGIQAGSSNTKNQVTAIGFGTAVFNTGERLTAVGHGAATAANAFDDVTAVGYNAQADANGQFVMSDGVTNIKAIGMASTAGYVLTDVLGDGHLTMQPPGGSSTQDLDAVTTAGNTTGNSIIVAGITANGTVIVNNNAVITGFVEADGGVQVGTDQGVIFFGGAGSGVGTIKNTNIIGTWDYQLPDAAGTFGVTVNGIPFDVNGDVSVSFTESDPVFSSWLSNPPNVSEFTNDLGYLVPGFFSGSGADYVLGDGTIGNLNSAISGFGYITGETDPVWTSVSGNYLLSSTAASTYALKTITITGGAGNISVSGSGDLSANRTIGQSKSTASIDGYLAATDFTNFNSKQAGNSNLTTIAGLTPTTDNFIIGVASAWASRTPSQARTTLGLVIGTNVQSWDTDLDAIAALTPSNDDIIQRKLGVWTNRTIAQYKSDLSLTGTNSGDQTITLTGNVTGSGTGSFATTIANGAVSNQMLATSSTNNFNVASPTGAVSASTAGNLFSGVGTVTSRVQIGNGSSSSIVSTSGSYGNVIITKSILTTASSGTHPILANLVVNPLGTITSGGALVTNSTSFYVDGASSGGSTNWASYVASGNSFFGGDVKLGTVGNGLYIKEGSNASMGVATLVAGTVTISTTKVTANSRIILTVQSLGTVSIPTVVGVTSRSAGTSFTITSASITDTSVIAWIIIEPS